MKSKKIIDLYIGAVSFVHGIYFTMSAIGWLSWRDAVCAVPFFFLTWLFFADEEKAKHEIKIKKG